MAQLASATTFLDKLEGAMGDQVFHNVSVFAGCHHPQQAGHVAII